MTPFWRSATWLARVHVRRKNPLGTMSIPIYGIGSGQEVAPASCCDNLDSILSSQQQAENTNTNTHWRTASCDRK